LTTVIHFEWLCWKDNGMLFQTLIYSLAIFKFLSFFVLKQVCIYFLIHFSFSKSMYMVNLSYCPCILRR
jgi:hypothetical protein